jgi:hypothetical protein
LEDCEACNNALGDCRPCNTVLGDCEVWDDLGEGDRQVLKKECCGGRQG